MGHGASHRGTQLWSGKNGLVRGGVRKGNSIYSHRAMEFDNINKESLGLDSGKFIRNVKRGQNEESLLCLALTLLVI